jgi:hypothetical protein
MEPSALLFRELRLDQAQRLLTAEHSTDICHGEVDSF